MTDIVERLREIQWPLTHEAADEIERLRQRVRALEGMLGERMTRAVEPKP